MPEYVLSYPLTLLIVSLFCVGVQQLFLPKMLLGRLPLAFAHRQNAWWYKPVFGCVGCFASTWGTLAFFLLYGLVVPCYQLPILGWVALWALHVVPAVFTNRLLWHLFQVSEKLTRYP